MSWAAQKILTSALSLGQETGPSWAMQGEKAGAVSHREFGLEHGLAGEPGPHTVGFSDACCFPSKKNYRDQSSSLQ